METSADAILEFIRTGIREAYIFRSSPRKHPRLARYLYVSDGEELDSDLTKFFAESNFFSDQELDNLLFAEHEVLMGSAVVGPDFWALLQRSIDDWVSQQSWATVSIETSGRADSASHSVTGSSIEVWRSSESPLLVWGRKTPASLSMARLLIENGRGLHELSPKDFELLLADLLERDGWQVRHTGRAGDAGVDVLSERSDPTLGTVRAIWQAKRFSPPHKVQLFHVRELLGTLEDHCATKAMIATTSRLTKGAIDFVIRHGGRVGKVEYDGLEEWIRRHFP
ncbi:MAG TPA: restriction endonuclease [Phycisphaerales bacterium]|nr:restriction endonuclease [Phycisphaerales bacterium]